MKRNPQLFISRDAEWGGSPIFDGVLPGVEGHPPVWATNQDGVLERVTTRRVYVHSVLPGPWTDQEVLEKAGLSPNDAADVVVTRSGNRYGLFVARLNVSESGG